MGHQACAALQLKRHPSAWSNTALATSYCWQFCQGVSLSNKTYCKYKIIKGEALGTSEEHCLGERDEELKYSVRHTDGSSDRSVTVCHNPMLHTHMQPLALEKKK